MASDRIVPLIDFSEFLSDSFSPKEAAEAVQGHIKDLQQSLSCNKIEKVKLLGVGDRLGFPCGVTRKMIIAVLHALLPKSGQIRTIQQVELDFHIDSYDASETDPPELEDSGNLTIECLYLYDTYRSRPYFKAITELIEKLLTGIVVKRTELVCMYMSYNPLTCEEKKSYRELSPKKIKVSFESYKLQPEPEDYTKCHTTFIMDEFQSELFPNSTRHFNLQLEQIHANTSRGGGVAVAVLSSGYEYSDQKRDVFANYNFTSPFSPVHDLCGLGSMFTRVVSKVAPDAKLIPCKTTSGWPWFLYTSPSDHTSSSAHTSRAINQLREKWKAREWGEDVHSLVVLIPYGGHYREDEMRAINAAIDDGIIVVCAAGDTTLQTRKIYKQVGSKHIPGIAFPASMGNVLCVGAVDENDEPEINSPSGREVDCVAPCTYDRFKSKGTGISAAILSGLIAIILSFIESSLNKPPGTCPEYNHVSIIREVLQQTTTSAKHHPHSGYGLFTSRLFSFSEHQLKKLLNSITQERIFRTIPGSASEMTEQCKFNSEILCNNELNSELQLPVTLDGEGIRVAVIDDDFPQILKTNYVADELQTEMHSWDECTPSLSENAELLNGSIKSLNELACSLRKKIPYVEQGALQLEEKAKSIESQIKSMTEEVCLHFTSVKDSHGLQCALVVANTTPKADLFLVNSGFDSTSLATMIENLVERRKRPDVIVCSLGFDQFNRRLSKAVNKAINAGIIPVFSAGNIGLTGSNTISYPSRLGNVLCIGAHTWHGTSHSFSSVGREVDFLAPGEFMILGKYPVSGTSFAAPAVAAFIALILQYVDKIVSGEWKQRPLEDKYKSIEAWSEEEPGTDRWSWNKIPLNVACRNVYVMRELLRQMSVHRTEHSDSAGYGNLDIRRLLKDLEPEDIHSIVQNFHLPPP